MTDAALIASLRRELAIARRLNDDLIAVLGPMNEVALACGRPKLTSDPTDIPYPEVGTGFNKSATPPCMSFPPQEEATESGVGPCRAQYGPSISRVAA